MAARILEFLTSLAKVVWYIAIGLFKLVAPVKKKDVKNEIVLVTGAGSGIGKLIAMRYRPLSNQIMCTKLIKMSNLVCIHIRALCHIQVAVILIYHPTRYSDFPS